MSYLIHHFKALEDYLFLLILLLQVLQNDEAGKKNNQQYFFPTEEVNNYNVLINGRNIYDQRVMSEKYQQDTVMVIQQTVY